MQAARDAGLKLKFHADELASMGGAELAAELGAVSADHLGYISEEGIKAMAAAGTVAVLLPGTTFSLQGKQYAPARRMMEAGMVVALSTDCNPGSSFTESLAMIVTLSVLQMKTTTAEAISAVGATPVFVDVDPATYLIDLTQIEAAISPATRALIPVHLFGRPVDMDQLMAIARRHDLKVVEDCAQATGASWNGQPVGSWGDVGCFSFFPTKNLGGAGDGGAVTCRDGELAQRMRELAVHGMPRRYLHTELGYNSRLDALQAAVLNVKLPHLGDWVEKRRAIAARYQKALEGLPGLQRPDPASAAAVGHGWNQFVVRVRLCPENQPHCAGRCDDPASSFGLPSSRCRDWLKQSLQEQGVSTIIYYPIPIHRQPAYADQQLAPGSLPVTEQLCSEVLSLPIFPELSLEQQDQVIAVLRTLLARNAQAERMVA